MSSLARAEIINPLLLLSIIVFDVGRHRRIGWFRILEPLILVGAIVPFFFDGSGLSGNGVLLEAAGAFVGIGAGLGALSLMRVYRSPETGRAASAAGRGYILFWVAFLGARALFTYGSSDWFSSQLGSWLAHNDIPVAGFTDAFIFVAIAPLLTRTVGLAVRSGRILRAAPSPAGAHPAAPVGSDGRAPALDSGRAKLTIHRRGSSS